MRPRLIVVFRDVISEIVYIIMEKKQERLAGKGIL